MYSRTLVSFVRHGEVHNPQEVYYGRLPGFHLSEKGVRQATTVSRLLRRKKLGAVFSSPLLRARQTASAILTAHPELALQQSKLLLEVHSPYDGCPLSELIERNWDLYSIAPRGYEQPSDILKRATKFLSLARRRYAGQHVVAVTHGDVIAFLILWARQVPVNAKNKEDLQVWGLQDKYPAPGSLLTVAFKTAAPDEIPDLNYQRIS